MKLGEVRDREVDPPVPDGGSQPDEAARAEAYALDLLARRQRSVFELRQRLMGRGYQRSTAEALIERLLRVGYLDDWKFARTWVEVRGLGRPCGPALLRQELRLKGVPVEIVSEALRELLGPEVERDLAVQAAAKRVGRTRGQLRSAATTGSPLNASDTRKARQQLRGFLRRRGFSGSACQAGVESAFGQDWEVEE